MGIDTMTPWASNSESAEDLPNLTRLPQQSGVPNCLSLSYFQDISANSTVSTAVLAGLLCVFVFIIGMILSTPVFLLRWIIIQLAKHLRADLGKPLNPLSVALVGDLYSSGGKPPRANFIIPVTLDANMELAPFEKLVLDGWIHSQESDGELKYPQFSQFPESWFGSVFWKNDTQFDVKNHVYLHPNPNGGTDDQLNCLIEELLNAPHHPCRSPWELHIFNNYQNPKFHYKGEMSMLILKIHHSLADGYSVLNAVAEGLFGQGRFTLPNVRTPQRRFWEKLAYQAMIPFTGAMELGRVMQEQLRDNSWKIPDEEKAWHQSYSKSEHIPIQKIKHIKDALKVTFTSVLLSGLSSAIHKNLEGKRMNQTLRVEYAKDSLQCVSMLPIPVKRRTDRLTNHVTGAVFHIPIGAFRGSLDRLLECDRVLEETKQSVIPALASFYLTCVGSHFRWLPKFLAKRQTIATGLTNFPSVAGDFNGTVLGRRPLFSEAAVGGLEGGAGVVFTVVSSHGYIRFAVTAEKGLLSRKESDALIRSVEEEIDILYYLSNSNKMM